jgi:hypothetical protein
MKRLAAVACASMFAPLLALADPHTADEWYKQGENEYNLGNFEKAADAFKQGFALEANNSKKPVYLYNVAQAYRQANRCKDAEFFYKRFLSLKEGDTVKPLKASTKAEIEQWITQLEDCVKQQEAVAKKPEGGGHPDGDPTKAGASAGAAAGPGTGRRVASTDRDTGEDEGDITKRATGAPQLLSAQLVAGISKISAGTTTVPVEPTFTLIAGYPLYPMPKLELDVGGLFGFTPVPFVNSMTNAKQTGKMMHLMADAGAVYVVAPKIDVRGDLGVGMLVFGGISDMGNPFTQDGAPTSGALAMFAIRIAAAADYELTKNVVATVSPAFAYSPAKAGLRSDIHAITSFDFLIGVGYRM